jgi:hypothetical protein
MNNLKLTSVGQYRNKKGTLVFRYKVSGSPSALQAYEDSQGEYYTVDDKTGDPLFFTPRFAGKTATLVVTDEGRAYVDMSELEQQASIIAQFGGNLGQAMADAFARKLSGGGSASETPASQPKDRVDLGRS